MHEIPLITFDKWVEKYQKVFSTITNIKCLNLSGVVGVDPWETIIFKVPDSSQKSENGEPKLVVRNIADSKLLPVIDLPPSSFMVFKNNTFLINSILPGNISIKCYGLKTGPILFHCVNIENYQIPFLKEKVKRKNNGKINVKSVDQKCYINKLDTSYDNEGVFLLYKQAQKIHSQLKTRRNAADWFLIKQQEVVDINHLIKIDNVLQYIFSI